MNKISIASPPGVGCTLLVILLTVLSTGCAQKGPILIEGLAYQAPEGMTAGKGSVMVAVSSFRDLREVKPSVIGLRNIRSDVTNDLVAQSTAADIVSEAIIEALKVRGMQCRKTAPWDLAETSISAEGADILLGGEIKALWVEALSDTPRIKYKATVQLRVIAADVKDRKIFRTMNLQSSLEQDNVVYSDYTVQEMFNGALTGAINQLLNDEEFRKRIY